MGLAGMANTSWHRKIWMQLACAILNRITCQGCLATLAIPLTQLLSIGSSGHSRCNFPFQVSVYDQPQARSHTGLQMQNGHGTPLPST
jgi:hypothetical protein